MQQVQRIRFVLAAAFTTCALVGTAGAQTPQQDQPSSPPPSQQAPSQQPSQQAPSHEEGMPSQQQPSQKPMGKEGQMGQQGAGTEVMAERMSATATVEKVDMSKRKMTLKDEQGQTFKVDIPKNIKNADKIKKGDKINLDYYSSVTLSLHKQEPGGKAPSAGEMEAEGRTAAKLPGGVMAKEITASAEVTKVDTANNMVTLKLPNGDMDTIHVTDPQLQSKLSDLKVGDRIRAKYTEAVAITVTPPEKNKG